MARPLRLESAGGVYHVLNRGNCRADIFRPDKAKAAFLKCRGEACAKTVWLVHAWCLMSNHYHLAVFTPGANLVGGMRWLQGTFSTRFNRLRCHYIHLNPIRARLRPVADLPDYRWTSLPWLLAPKSRPD